MASQFSPPANVDVAQRTVLGVDYRKIAIFVVSIPIALAVVVVWRSAPLFVRGAIAVLIAFMGVALAFGQIEGKAPEAWLKDFLLFGRRDRFMLHRALRGRVDNRKVVFGPEEKEEPVALALPDFFVLSANAIGAAALTALTIWLYTDGAHRMSVLWGSLTRISGVSQLSAFSDPVLSLLGGIG